MVHAVQCVCVLSSSTAKAGMLHWCTGGPPASQPAGNIKQAAAHSLVHKGDFSAAHGRHLEAAGGVSIHLDFVVWLKGAPRQRQAKAPVKGGAGVLFCCFRVLRCCCCYPGVAAPMLAPCSS